MHWRWTKARLCGEEFSICAPCESLLQDARLISGTPETSPTRKRNGTRRCHSFRRMPVSDPHRHDHVPILEFVARVVGTHLAGGLGIFELQADFAGIRDFQELEQILRVEADSHRV